MTAERWYYGDRGERKGPFARAELAELMAAGAIKDDTQVWVEGSDGWRMARDVGELRASWEAPAAVAATPVAPAGTAAPSLASRPGHVPFKQVYREMRQFSAGLTIIGVLVKTLPPFIEDIKRMGAPAASLRFGLVFTAWGILGVLVNMIVLALPLAGILYYLRNVNHPR